MFPNLQDTRYGSDEYFGRLQNAHNEEEKQFESAGWRTLNCSRPFYNHPAGEHLPDGDLRTVAQTATESPGPGFEWYVAAGDTTPPEGAWRYRSVWEKRGGEWVRVKNEEVEAA